jgi:hypothetical protein
MTNAVQLISLCGMLVAGITAPGMALKNGLPAGLLFGVASGLAVEILLILTFGVRL